MKTQYNAHRKILPGLSTRKHPDTKLTRLGVAGWVFSKKNYSFHNSTMSIPRDGHVRVPRYFPQCRGDQRCPWGVRGPAVKIPSNLHQATDSHSAGPHHSELRGS